MLIVCLLFSRFPKGGPLSGEASPVFPGEWPLTFPRTEGGGLEPAPRRGARLSSGVARKVAHLLGSALGGLARKMQRLHGPLDRLGHRCHGAKTKMWPGTGFLYGREAPDWTSDRYRNRRRQPKAGFVPAASGAADRNGRWLRGTSRPRVLLMVVSPALRKRVEDAAR